MTNHWIDPTLVLKDETVSLVPLQESHFESLYAAASDPVLWERIPVNCSKRETFERAYSFALSEREKGNQYPYVIVYNETGELIGSTRLFEIYPADKKMEIGWTWIIQKYWSTEVNFACKLLLLNYCFDMLQARRVQIKTDETNLRSRAAIEKLGAHFEGVLRKDRIKEDGHSRNAAYYSIIDDEWPFAKQKIIEQLAKRKTT